MTTQETTVPITEKITEKKREVISIQVSPEEKRQITTMAVKDCGISVSEFVRTKIFTEFPKETEAEAMTDEERQIYEDKLSDLNEAVKSLKTDIVNLKVGKASPSAVKGVEVAPLKENGIIFDLAEDFKATIEKIKTFRAGEIEKMSEEQKANVPDINKYFKTIFLRGLRRSYNNGFLAKYTGLTTDDIKLMADSEAIDYGNEV